MALIRRHKVLIVPKTWDTMLRADRTTEYNFMESMNPVHIIQENKAIPTFSLNTSCKKIWRIYWISLWRNMFLQIYRVRWSRHDTVSNRNVSDQERYCVSKWRKSLRTMCEFYEQETRQKSNTKRYWLWSKLLCDKKIRTFWLSWKWLHKGDYTRVINVLVFVCIAHKMRVELLFGKHIYAIC